MVGFFFFLFLQVPNQVFERSCLYSRCCSPQVSLCYAMQSVQKAKVAEIT